jgi:hypothetical protein
MQSITTSKTCPCSPKRVSMHSIATRIRAYRLHCAIQQSLPAGRRPTAAG